MYMLRSLTAAIATCAYLIPTGLAHSRERNPLTYLSRVDNPVVNTPSHRVHALSSFEVTFKLHDGAQTIRLTLAPNHDVIAPGATVQYLNADGTVHDAEPIDRLEYRVFKGDAWLRHYPGAEWTNVGWARIMVQQDGENPLFEGAFRVDGNHHHVQTRTNYMQTKHLLDPILNEEDKEYLVVWRDSDISENLNRDSEGYLHTDLRRGLGEDLSCSADRLGYNSMDPMGYMAAPDSLWDWGATYTRRIFGRQIDGQTQGNSAGVNLSSTIGKTDGCFSTKKVALVGVATDCTYTGSFNSTESARANIISVINAASVPYESSFNITLGLQNLLVSNASCPSTPASATPWNIDCSSSVTIQDRLNLFSGWRGEQNDNNTYWTLLSNCPDGSAVGLAWLGQACVSNSQVTSTSSGNETVSGANVVVRTGTEWQVIAHETGHTFGAVHDCTSDACNDGTTVQSQQCCPLSSTECDAGGQFIMNPSTRPDIQKFSPCTIGTVCSAIGRNSVKTSCLTDNKDVKLLSGSQCGNGIVETGEECDCGGTDSCGENSCCDATTCKFTTNSVCDPSNEACCTNSCQFASSGTVCRESTGSCDPEETCSGTVASCPDDNTAEDGTDCGDKSQDLSCASGQCTSRDLQCKTLMGSYTQGNDTYACSSGGCQISCASPEFGANVCYSMQQYFLDGTSCEGGGRCSNGQCEGASVGKEISSWIHDNKTLVIALASVLGTIFLLIILSCIYNLYRRRNPKAIPSRRRGPMQQARWPGANHLPWGNHQSENWPLSNSPPAPSWQPAVRYA